MCPWTPLTLQSANASISTLQPQAMQISRHSLAWWAHNLLKVNKTRDDTAQAHTEEEEEEYKAQAHTHIQRHMNNTWSEMISCFPCFFFLLLLFGSYKQYGITLITL
jgi:hypothetical protein